MNYIIFAFLSAVCYGTGQILMRTVLKTGINPITATAFGTIFSTTLMWVICWSRGILPTKTLVMFNVSSFVMIAFFGMIMVMGTVFANVAMSYPEGKVAVVNIISLVGALVVATLLALFFLGEELNFKIILGLVLASSGVLLLSL